MRSSLSAPPARPDLARPAEAGFTLVELLVALVMSGFVAVAILRLISAESRFISIQGAREEVLQNARGTLEVLTGELRALSPASGLLEASDSMVRFLYPRVWGVVCADGPPGAAELVLAVPWLGSDGAYGAQAGALVSNAGVALHTRADGWQRARAAEAALLPAGAPCEELGAQGSELRQLRLRGLSLPVAAERGELAYLYEELKYDLGTSAGIPGVWVRRSSGASGGALSQQPLAGPVARRGGLSFQYLLADGTVKGTPSPAERAQVVAIGVRIASESQARGAGVQQHRTDSAFVRLRNREP